MSTWKNLFSVVVLVVALSFIVISNSMDDKPQTEDLGIYTVTAYCPCKVCCGRYADGITASGHKILPGDCFVAAPPEIPFGTWLIVPGYNDGWPVKVLDRGGVIKGKNLDVFFGVDPDSSRTCTPHERALEWGRQTLRITKLNYMKEVK